MTLQTALAEYYNGEINKSFASFDSLINKASTTKDKVLISVKYAKKLIETEFFTKAETVLNQAKEMAVKSEESSKSLLRWKVEYVFGKLHVKTMYFQKAYETYYATLNDTESMP